jgi:hypothetical protein
VCRDGHEASADRSITCVSSRISVRRDLQDASGDTSLTGVLHRFCLYESHTETCRILVTHSWIRLPDQTG